MIDTVNGKELAEMLGVTTRWIADLEKKGVLFKSGYGEWDLRKSVQGYCRYVRAQSAPADGPDGYEADKARKMKADADRAELDVAKAAGAVVEAARVGKVVESGIAVAVAKLANVGRKAAPRARIAKSNKDAAKIIEDEIRSACEELHGMDIAALVTADEEAEAHAPDAEPVGDADGGAEGDE
jgi:phage terminase Nu1 subunit (DNA packaging protein)